jgi:flagellar L-ring protein precursor FlgH
MNPRPASPFSKVSLSLGLGVASLLAACSSTPEQLVQSPTTVRPSAPPSYLEHTNNGAIYQAHGSGWLFQDEQRPAHIGDTVKIDIGETQTASSKVKSAATRENKITAKGPGGGDTASQGGLIKSLLNIDATASGSDSFTGDGKTENSNSFTGRLAASVINVLPNGYLVVAGEKSIAFNGGTSTLRFSGIVSPKDIKPGGVVASADVVDAKLEQLGKGDVAATSSRTWIQRVLTNSLTMW